MAEIKMDAAHEVAIMEGAIALYGVESQVNMAIEEMAELTQALLKLRRAESDTARYVAVVAIREEMADVSIMLSQLELIYGDVSDIEEAKLWRLQNRLEDAVHDTMDSVMPWEASEV